MRIALVIDNKVRDLAGLILVAAELARQGHSCHLVPMTNFYREITALAPDFVLLNHLRNSKQRIASAFLSAGIRVGVLDQEGGVMPNLEHYARTVASDDKLREGVTSFYTWGPVVSNFLREHGYYRDSQIVVTGVPRADYYTLPWREVIQRHSTTPAALGRPLILVAGNFSICNPAYGSLENEVNRWVKEGHNRNNVLHWMERNRATMCGMVELANFLAQALPDYTIVYRPHPFENLVTYKNLLGSFPNLHLTLDGPLQDWLLHADIVIQHGSSTGIEAGLASVPSLIPGWLPGTFEIPSVEACSIVCDSTQQLVEKIRSFVENDQSIPLNTLANIQKVIEDWYYKVDGNAYRRIACDIQTKLANGNAQQVDLDRCRTLHYMPWFAGTNKPRLRTRAGAVIRKTAGLPADRSLTSITNQYKRFGSSRAVLQLSEIQSFLVPIEEIFRQKHGMSGRFVAERTTDYVVNYSSPTSVTIIQDCSASEKIIGDANHC